MARSNAPTAQGPIPTPPIRRWVDPAPVPLLPLTLVCGCLTTNDGFVLTVGGGETNRNDRPESSGSESDSGPTIKTETTETGSGEQENSSEATETTERAGDSEAESPTHNGDDSSDVTTGTDVCRRALCAFYNDEVQADKNALAQPGLYALPVAFRDQDRRIVGVEVYTGGQVGPNRLAIWSDLMGYPFLAQGGRNWTSSLEMSWQGVDFEQPIDVPDGEAVWVVWNPDNGQRLNRGGIGPARDRVPQRRHGHQLDDERPRSHADAPGLLLSGHGRIVLRSDANPVAAVNPRFMVWRQIIVWHQIVISVARIDESPAC